LRFAMLQHSNFPYLKKPCPKSQEASPHAGCVKAGA
jgi:hypothetical protein